VGRALDLVGGAWCWLVLHGPPVKWLLLIALVTGCQERDNAPAPPTVCQVWVYPPSLPPYLWTCTSGGAASFNDGRPDHIPCVLSTAPQWSPVEGGTAVADCDICTPAQLTTVDPEAKCAPGGEEVAWKFAPDGGADLGE
jgi:hypothetical protein